MLEDYLDLFASFETINRLNNECPVAATMEPISLRPGLG